jgi:hypothetical protein
MRKLQVQPSLMPLRKEECVVLLGGVRLGGPFTAIIGGHRMSIINDQQHLDRSANISIV